MVIVDRSVSIERAAADIVTWLRELREWPSHPVNHSGSVSSHFGPTILSEHDCVLHFARHLNAAGVEWEDMHLEFSPGQWMFTRARGAEAPKRIDLALIALDRLAAAPLPAAVGELRFEAVFEFALASNYWQFGAGSPTALLRKVDLDIAKVGAYLRAGLADHGFVVVVEECDHRFPPGYQAAAWEAHSVEVLLLRRWT